MPQRVALATTHYVPFSRCTPVADKRQLCRAAGPALSERTTQSGDFQVANLAARKKQLNGPPKIGDDQLSRLTGVHAVRILRHYFEVAQAV
jgi:hypothetical protein